ncbi:MAG: amidohydrolase family protein, partial [Thermoproteus sp.]|nr:amidohydrolase family protein [Thermoproteus sp.]
MILRARYVITPSKVFKDGAVAWEGGVITAVGPYEAVAKEHKGEIVERPRHIVMPGLVDCHVHTQQYLLRSSVADAELELPQIWTEVLIPFEKGLTRERAYLSSLATLAELAKGGVTAFVEVGAPYPDAVAEAAERVGLRGYISASTYDVYKGEVVEDHKEILRRTEEVLNMGGGLVKGICSIRQLTMASEDLLRGIGELCERRRAGVTFHLAEFHGEIDYSLLKYGRRPLEVLDSFGITRLKPAIASHGVYLSDREVQLAAARGVGICWAPTVDAYIMGLHWIPLYDGIKFGLGSDGGAFSGLDILHEVKVARALGKALTTSLQYYKASLDAQTLLEAATSMRGLLDFGVLAPGRPADIAVLEAKFPVEDPAQAIVGFLERDSVTDVVAAGRFIGRGG